MHIFVGVRFFFDFFSRFIVVVCVIAPEKCSNRKTEGGATQMKRVCLEIVWICFVSGSKAESKASARDQIAYFTHQLHWLWLVLLGFC